jgi:K+-sensing histidine kinase KdpD
MPASMCYTTVNIQHLESLNDVVHRITGVRVSETVPDMVFDRLRDIVLVDLPARELIERLRKARSTCRNRRHMRCRRSSRHRT